MGTGAEAGTAGSKGAGAVMTAGWNTGGAAMSSEGAAETGAVTETTGAGPRSAPIKKATKTVVRATNGTPTCTSGDACQASQRWQRLSKASLRPHPAHQLFCAALPLTAKLP